MCGVVAVIGRENASKLVIEGLKKLEYRGYDSAGIATLSDGEINEVKSEGRVDNLENNFKSIKNKFFIKDSLWKIYFILL